MLFSGNTRVATPGYSTLQGGFIMAKNVHTQKTIHWNDKKYIGFKRGGSINVKVFQTAKGQRISAGTYDIATQTWNDCSRKCCLPTTVKKMFEAAFGV